MPGRLFIVEARDVGTGRIVTRHVYAASFELARRQVAAGSPHLRPLAVTEARR